jgi:hypothetical protein
VKLAKSHAPPPAAIVFAIQTSFDHTSLHYHNITTHHRARRSVVEGDGALFTTLLRIVSLAC